MCCFLYNFYKDLPNNRKCKSMNDNDSDRNDNNKNDNEHNNILSCRYRSNIVAAVGLSAAVVVIVVMLISS